MVKNILCQNCKQDFILENEDIELLSKLKVPNPTFCPSCSHQRRFAWRNTHALYHRPDSVTGEDLISIYHKDTPMNIVSQEYWWSDSWDPMDYGSEYDFSKDFFTQWRDLRDKIPFQALSNSKAVNSDYCNVAEESYDSYLCSACWKTERSMYSDSTTYLKDSLDCYVVNKNEFCYENIYCSDSNRLFYCEKTKNSTNSYFLYDSKNCVDCFMSSNLRNKSYVFRNQQLTRDDYFKKISEINFDSYKTIELFKNEFESLKLHTIHRYATIVNSFNVTGDNLERVSDAKNVFDVSDNIKNVRHAYWCVKNIFDSMYSNAIGAIESSYEMNDAGVGGSFCRFGSVVYSSNEIDYSFNCYNCHDLFGCIGLRNKSYCILNKQYTKEQYLVLIDKIKEHMTSMPYVDSSGKTYSYGEFFPIELSPFAYNETIANMFYPLKRDEALSRGYKWRDVPNKNYIPTLLTENIPDSILDVDNSILDEIIKCSHIDSSFDRCVTVFKITQAELDFYKRLNIPIPRLCYQCRHFERFKKRNPLNLWTRNCMNKNSKVFNGQCENVFETSYSPERLEIVYCDDCYKQEVL